MSHTWRVVDRVLDAVGDGRVALAHIDPHVDEQALADLALGLGDPDVGVQREAADLDRDLGLGVPSSSSSSSTSSNSSGSSIAALTVAAATARASWTGATSWTRNIRAPRSYAITLVASVAATRSSSSRPVILPEERLARGPDEHRPAQRDQLVQPRQQLEVVRERLAEADPRVEHDPPLVDPVRDRELDALLQERLDLGDDVVVARVVLHRPRLAQHVHQAEVGAGPRDHGGHLRVATQGGDVVDERRARARARARPPRPWRCRSRSARRRPRRCRPSITGSTRRSSSSSDRVAPGRVDSPPTSRIAAPLGLEREPVLDRAGRIEVPPAVGEGVRA